MPANNCFERCVLYCVCVHIELYCTICLGYERKMNQAYTTYPSEHDGMLTDTFSPTVSECAFISLIFRRISFSDFGAFIFTEPKYVTPANSVQS